MNVSLNEIEVLAKRASRGAGYAWGIAEESGKATRWLAAHGFASLETLLDLLKHKDSKSVGDAIPVATNNVWHAPSGELCPLVAGTILCDRMEIVAEGRDLVFGSVLHPLFVVPFAAMAAKISDATFEMRWDGIVMVVAARKVSMVRGDINQARSCTQTVSIRRVEIDILDPVERLTHCSVDETIWARLNEFAHRTFAPATQASRLSGAGAGLSDND